jgi:hypothetical protein
MTDRDLPHAARNGADRDADEWAIPTADPADDPAGEAAALASDRRALEPVRTVLAAAGFWAYGTLSDEGRWTVAADDEAGHVDVRVGADGYAVELWATSPGLFADEENDFRRRTRERLVRMTLPAINRGLLAAHQSARWDESEGGVQVRLRYELPFTRRDDIGEFVRDKLPELEETLTFVEQRVLE